MKGVQLRAQVVAGENPKLLVWDTNSNNVLIQIRTYLQYKDNTSYQRNIVEKGPLLSLVANAIENKEKTSPTKKSAVKKPAVSRTPTKKIVNPQVNAPPASSTQPPAPPLPTDNNVELVGPENI
jgi:hypothetical protein